MFAFFRSEPQRVVGERRENKGSGYELMHIDVTDGASRARPPRLDDAVDSDMRVTARRHVGLIAYSALFLLPTLLLLQRSHPSP